MCPACPIREWSRDTIPWILSSPAPAPHPENRAGFHNTVSLDQFAAEHIGDRDFPTLSLSHEGSSLSWTRSGRRCRRIRRRRMYSARLFVQGRPEEVQAQLRRLRDGQSILDKVGGQAEKLEADLGGRRPRQAQRILHQRSGVGTARLVKADEWSKKPKPKVDAQPPQDIPNAADVIGRTRLLFDVTHLALQTDSTRLVTTLLGGTSTVPPIQGVSLDHHNLSHHGQDPAKIAQLKIIELETMKALRDLLAKLKQSKEENASLLDRTTVFFGSNLGNGSSHSCKNLPILVSGGGFKHGRHLAFDPNNPPPLCNLYVTMLQRLGVETDHFGSSTGTLTGLETAN